MIKKSCILYICDGWHEIAWTESLGRVEFDAFIFLKQKVFSDKRKELKKQTSNVDVVLLLQPVSGRYTVTSTLVLMNILYLQPVCFLCHVSVTLISCHFPSWQVSCHYNIFLKGMLVR